MPKTNEKTTNDPYIVTIEVFFKYFSQAFCLFDRILVFSLKQATLVPLQIHPLPFRSNSVFFSCLALLKVLQELQFSFWDNDDGSKQIFRHLNHFISLAKIQRWCKDVQESKSVSLFQLSGQ